MAFFGVEPFGEVRGDIQAGIVAATFANANRKKGSKALNPADFMPKFGDEGQSEAEMLAAAQAWQRRLGSSQ